MGLKIVSRAATKEYIDNWDRIFKSKKKINKIDNKIGICDWCGEKTKLVQEFGPPINGGFCLNCGTKNS